MSEKHELICDACDKHVDIYQADGWMQVRTYIASFDFAQTVRSARDDERDDGTNHGDFCSLRCLSEWANTNDVLRGLNDS